MCGELENGTTSKIETHDCITLKKKYVCWAEQDGVDPPPPPPKVKDPIHSQLDMITNGERP